MEVGAPATLFLLGTWDGHLTPTEVANMADRMSRSHERSTVEAAAQLALSCLKHSVSLNPNEITRAYHTGTKSWLGKSLRFQINLSSCVMCVFSVKISQIT